MSGHRPFDDLTKAFSPVRRKRIDNSKAKLRTAMALHELRRAQEMTQQALGKELNVNQPAVAKLERRADVYVSNLRSYIQALGGKLTIVARFPQGDVEITNFSDVHE